MMDRRDVVNLHENRIKARGTLGADAVRAKTDLHPRAIAGRWTAKQKSKAHQAADDASNLMKKNALLISAIGIGALLFMNRKPILKLTNAMRRARKTEQEPT